MKLQITSPAANIRASATIGNNVIRVEKQGTLLTVLNKVSGQVVNSSDIWYQVSPSGYIHSSVVVIKESLKPLLQAFIYKNNLKYRDYDGVWGAQCVDLANFWADEVKMTLPKLPTARDIFINYQGTQFKKCYNGDYDIPLPGDILFWDMPYNVWTRQGRWDAYGITGSAGHVAIFVDGDLNSLKSLDQNYPTGAPCQIVTHSYRGIMGWLRPNV